MEATRAFSEATKRGVSGRTLEWIDELAQEFGDEVVAREIRVVAADPAVKITRVLSTVRDRLAKAAAVRDRAPTIAPIQVEREQLLRIVRGQESVPTVPFIYSTADLTREEYREVVPSRRFGVMARTPA